MATDGFQQGWNVDGESSLDRDAHLRLPHFAYLPGEPGHLPVVGGWHFGPGDSGASGMVREFVYHRLGHVPAQFRWRRRRHRWNGRLGWVLQSHHSYAPLFSVAAASYLLGLLILVIAAPGLSKAGVPTEP